MRGPGGGRMLQLREETARAPRAAALGTGSGLERRAGRAGRTGRRRVSGSVRSALSRLGAGSV